MSLAAPGRPAAPARLLSQRRRAALVAAGLVLAFLPVDLAQPQGGGAAALLRLAWGAALLAAIAAQRPGHPRLAVLAGRLVGLASAAALLAIAAVTGGAASPHFDFLLALPLTAIVAAPDLPSCAALTSAATIAGGVALLALGGRPPLAIATWALMSLASGALAVWGTYLCRRAWATEVASELARASAAEELARSERRRDAAERLATMGRLAAGIAHEINNPLAYVKGNVQWMREALPEGRCSPEQAREVLADTCCGLEHIARVVADLQAFARGDREAPGPVAASELVEAALRLGSARLAGVAGLRVEVEPGLPPARAHARRVAQALLNLLVNAADAVQAAGGEQRIVVRACRAGDALAIEVEDSGPGLSAEAAEHLFEPFFTTKGSRGTGLGLALSRENVAASGGALEYRPAPGGGALFRIRLRCAEASSEPVAAEAVAGGGRA